MRIHVLIAGLIAVPIAAACGRSANEQSQSGASVAQAGATVKADKASDEAALRAMFDKMSGHLMAGDSKAFGAPFMADGLEIMPGMPPAKGPEAVSKGAAAVLAAMKNLKITFGEPAITIADAGDLAVLESSYRMTYTDGKGKSQEDHGSSITVFKKVNGAWQVLYDTNISEVAPGQ